MKSKLINWDKLNKENKNEIVEKDENILVKRTITENNIQFHLFTGIFDFEFNGVKIIQCLNTNKFLRMLFDDYGDSLISINEIKIRSKNIVIISPLTRINEIINTKTGGDINIFLKEKGKSEDIEKINKTISEIYFNKDDCLKNVTNIDLTKSDLINFLDVKEDFVNEENIIDILNVIKSNSSRKLIIFNDVDYLPIEKCDKWLMNFDFLYIMNSYEKNWERIKNFADFSLKWENDKLIDIIIDKNIN